MSNRQVSHPQFPFVLKFLLLHPTNNFTKIEVGQKYFWWTVLWEIKVFFYQWKTRQYSNLCIFIEISSISLHMVNRREISMLKWINLIFYSNATSGSHRHYFLSVSLFLQIFICWLRQIRFWKAITVNRSTLVACQKNSPGHQKLTYMHLSGEGYNN